MRAKLLLVLLSVMLVAPSAHAVSLTPTSEIFGTITEPDGTPIRACVSLYRGTNRSPTRSFTVDGEYGFLVQGDGPWFVAATDCASPRRSWTEWHNDQLDDRDATPITVAPGEAYRADFTMDRGGSVSGRVTNLEGDPLDEVCIRLLTEEVYGRRWVPGEQATRLGNTLTDGTFLIEGLKPGAEYTVSYLECPEESPYSTYGAQFYPNMRALEDAARITIRDREQVEGLDAVMQVGAKVSGMIDGPDGPADPCIRILDEHGHEIAGAGLNEDGAYESHLIPPGPTVLGFAGCRPGRYDVEYYDDAITFEDATVLNLAPGARVGGIDVTMTECVRSPDSDDDGLTDCEEIDRRTHISQPDTDGDGLLDGEEVHTYGTNPIDGDTDKDSFGDGFEVHGGTCAGLSFEGGSDPNDPTSTPLTPDQPTTVLPPPPLPRVC